MPIMSLSLALTILNVDPRTKQLAEVGIMLNKDTSMRESGYRGRNWCCLHAARVQSH
jgi:hypothetical protein